MWKRTLRLGDGLLPAAGLSDNLDLGLAFEHRPEGLPEEGVAIRQQHADRIRGIAQTNPPFCHVRSSREKYLHRRHAARTGQRSEATSIA